MQFKRKYSHDYKHSIFVKRLMVRQVVLLHDIRHKKNLLQKVFLKWLGLYGICNLVKDKDIYILEKLNRLHLSGSFAGDKFQIFHPWQQFYLKNLLNFVNKELSNLVKNYFNGIDSNFSDIPDNIC